MALFLLHNQQLGLWCTTQALAFLAFGAWHFLLGEICLSACGVTMGNAAFHGVTTSSTKGCDVRGFSPLEPKESGCFSVACERFPRTSNAWKNMWFGEKEWNPIRGGGGRGEKGGNSDCPKAFLLKAGWADVHGLGSPPPTGVHQIMWGSCSLGGFQEANSMSSSPCYEFSHLIKPAVRVCLFVS